MLESIRLVRQFTLVSLLAVVVVASALAALYAIKAHATLVQQGESKNATQVRLLLNQLGENDRAALDALLASGQASAPDSGPVRTLQQSVRRAAAGTSLVKLELYNKRGLTVFSTETRRIGADKSTHPGFVAVLNGASASQLEEHATFESMSGPLRAVAVIGSHLPVPDRNGAVAGVVEVYDDVTPLNRAIEATRWQVFMLAALVMLALYATLLYVVRKGSRRMALKERTLEHEVMQRGKLYSEALQAKQATERQQRETEKAYSAAVAARRAAEDGNQAKTDLLGKLGEEMRTPLNAIIGTTDVMLMSELTAAQREHATRVRAGAVALLRLANDLLAVAQPDADHQEPRLEVLSPLAMARDAVGLHGALARANGLAIECRAGPTAPDWALGDARRLRLLLTDLVGVAGRSGRGKSVTIEINRVLNVPGLVLRYEVRVEPGSGSGSDPIDLTAARRLAGKLDGTIDVESGAGQPLVLRLVVPLRPAGVEMNGDAVAPTQNASAADGPAARVPTAAAP